MVIACVTEGGSILSAVDEGASAPASWPPEVDSPVPLAPLPEQADTSAAERAAARARVTARWRIPGWYRHPRRPDTAATGGEVQAGAQARPGIAGDPGPR